jgi:hypothetical protein
VWSFGDGDNGKLGLGTTSDKCTPEVRQELTDTPPLLIDMVKGYSGSWELGGEESLLWSSVYSNST